MALSSEAAPLAAGPPGPPHPAGNSQGRPEASHDTPSHHGSAGADYEREILCLVNKERRRVGLNALALHPAVTQAAHEHSLYQARVGEMTHSDENYGPQLPENIADAPAASAKEVFDMWMKDPPHYENIVDPNVTYMGVSNVNGKWTQDFGSDSDTSKPEQAYYGEGYC
ncbi:hypothetical protein DL89DRAFT_295738 [Linderina pennispora]|uniref:SCP domain-containing protein n=1 Tax=Linderina pennispora TaxID=61395 RepID=A0A1Y1VXM4_9FUNG|nr:uncharacterized protein DL89DRAFT_295738 [Linderina pennispora]ORX66031.1 hypothetical protein DL89DRAFT_295738 [Linderina pennispora]